MKLLNTEARVIMAGDLKLVPGVPIEYTGGLDALKKLYPILARRIDDGKIQVLNEAQAKQAEQRLAEMTVEKLKEYAVSKGIKIDGTMKKEEIIAAIESAQKA